VFCEKLFYILKKEDMLDLKVLSATIVLTIASFAGFIGMGTANGQSDSPFANCIMIFSKDLQVLLSTDEDCDEQQFSEAVSYYKANGFPHEGSYTDMFGTKSMQLLTDYGNSLGNEMTK
jgi:hypothetical protein